MVIGTAKFPFSGPKKLLKKIDRLGLYALWRILLCVEGLHLENII